MAPFRRVESLGKTLTGPWPRPDLPQIAVAGRSNVGKSSLINRILGRRRLAKVGKTPGKTRALEFFLVDGVFVLADLPGYGYAQTGKHLRRLWSQAVAAYLFGPRPPAGAVVLLDGRHAPTHLDLLLVEALAGRDVRWLPVLTKADQVARSRRRPHADGAARALHCDPATVVWTSARTGEGVGALRAACTALATRREPARRE